MRLFSAGKPLVKTRGLHLDLKGLPPLPERLLELIGLFGDMRINCLLVEWEDVYPWRAVPLARAAHSYSRKDVVRILEAAAKRGIETIPLIQSYGHMESVLRHKPYRHLREDPLSPYELCASRKEGRELAMRMIDDILDTHRPFIKRFHIGGDEAHLAGTCPECSETLKRKGKSFLYKTQILPLADKLNAEGLRPILWDDMLRSWSEKDLLPFKSKADLMVWNYSPNPAARIGRPLLEKYRRAGVGIWAAGAFKGADGIKACLPDAAARSANLLKWARTVSKGGFEGMVATGWSRYGASTVPCEGVEQSLDMALVAARAMWNGKAGRDGIAFAQDCLAKGALKRYAGKRYSACKAKTEEFRKRVEFVERDPNRPSLLWLESLAFLAGEPERADLRTLGDWVEKVGRSLKEAEASGNELVEAFDGLVERGLMEKYVLSRLLPVKRRLDAFKEARKLALRRPGGA